MRILGILCGFAGLALAGAASWAQERGPEAKPQAGTAGQKAVSNGSAESANRPDSWSLLGGQATFTAQHLIPFHSPYEGANSLRSRDESEVTHTYTLYLGARFGRNAEVYLNPEVALGNGLNGGAGLAGYTNGEVIGQGSVPTDPYLARYFVRRRFAAGKAGGGGKAERFGKSQNVIAGAAPARRIVVTAGKFAASDIFDANAYANNPRTQFLNKSFANNAAWDFAQDLRGYSNGVAVSWVNPDWTLRAGTFMMPSTAGGRTFAGDLWNNRGDQIEYDRNVPLLGRPKPPATIRLLAFRNVANMGRYSDALAAASASGSTPDITAVRRRGEAKYGYGLNFEQAVADGGNTGVFLRAGWNDGSTESWCFGECDRTLTVGGQLAGSPWGRQDDRLGMAIGRNGISGPHRDYLAAGGSGINLGDGKLRYGEEAVFELYYAWQVMKPVSLSFDYQAVSNPGYNRDRGPLSVLSARLHAEF